jgi:4-amino-4-deoxy-L-arabinose transferase-like glycosyltransferase
LLLLSLAWLLLLPGKWLLASRMGLFGDEAFYWQESRHLALAYSDVPGLTAWLIRLGTDLFGSNYFAVRSLFLLLGTLLPLLVYSLAREFHSRSAALVAAAVATALPLVALAGVLAIPDVPLNLLTLLLAIGVVRALKTDAIRWWLLAGLATALGFACHYRFVVPAMAALLAVLATEDGRRSLKAPGPWIALVLAGLGLLPIILFNLDAAGAGFQFQLSDRHPWSFQALALTQPLQQAVVSTPLIYLLLLAAGIHLLTSRKARPGRWQVIAWMGVLPPVFYFLAGLWADQTRTTMHWPVAGYLVLCVAAPNALARLATTWQQSQLWYRSVCLAGFGIGVLLSMTLIVHLMSFVDDSDRQVRVSRLFPDNILGWPEVARQTDRILAESRQPLTLVADNFMLAAELAFERGSGDVISLDHPLNAHHGRAAQLAMWQLDEAALPTAAPLLVVMEETALGLAQQPAWARRLCSLGSVYWLGESVLYGGRKRFVYLRIEPGSGRCELPSFAYLDEPAGESRISGTVSIKGWAFRDSLGLTGVEILLNGQRVLAADYGLDRPEVEEFFAGSDDPNHPLVGFSAELDLSHLTGPQQLAVRSLGEQGFARTHQPIEVLVD